LKLADAGEAAGPLTDLGSGSGVLAIAAARLGWSPVTGYDHESAAIDAAASNASINGVTVTFHRQNLRESLPDLTPICVANMTSPILKAVAARLGAAGPAVMILSGILPDELDEVAAAFAPAGLAEQGRRQMGDWAALLLRRPR